MQVQAQNALILLLFSSGKIGSFNRHRRKNNRYKGIFSLLRTAQSVMDSIHLKSWRFSICFNVCFTSSRQSNFERIESSRRQFFSSLSRPSPLFGMALTRIKYLLEPIPVCQLLSLGAVRILLCMCSRWGPLGRLLGPLEALHNITIKNKQQYTSASVCFYEPRGWKVKRLH